MARKKNGGKVDKLKVAVEKGQRIVLAKSGRRVFPIRAIDNLHMEVQIPFTDEELRISRKSNSFIETTSTGKDTFTTRRVTGKFFFPKAKSHIQIVRKTNLKVMEE